jgi:antitoxin component YwqK of YwqJK toxin-antitoxin module
MLNKKQYINGQKTHDLTENVLTFYFKDGRVKAKGAFEHGMMQGEWQFYRATGELWQTGCLKDSQKHGRWERYDRDGRIEYNAVFENGREVTEKHQKKTI